MSFHAVTSETREPLLEGQHSDQGRGAGTLKQKEHLTEI